MRRIRSHYVTKTVRSRSVAQVSPLDKKVLLFWLGILGCGAIFWTAAIRWVWRLLS